MGKKNTETPTLDSIGIAKKDRTVIAEQLSKLLADTYLLYLKTHGFHWNITGPHFNSLHGMFMTQYNALWMAVDEIAERIRTLGLFAPACYAQFTKLSAIEEESGVPNWQEMVHQLAVGHERTATTARAVIKVAAAAGDEGTVDMATGRLKEHEKTAWMLSALLQ